MKKLLEVYKDGGKYNFEVDGKWVESFRIEEICLKDNLKCYYPKDKYRYGWGCKEL